VRVWVKFGMDPGTGRGVRVEFGGRRGSKVKD